MKKLVLFGLSALSIAAFGRSASEIVEVFKDLTDSGERKAFVDSVTPDEWRALADYQIEKAKGRKGDDANNHVQNVHPSAILAISRNPDLADIAREYDRKYAEVGARLAPTVANFGIMPLTKANWINKFKDVLPVVCGLAVKKSVKLSDLELGERINVIAENFSIQSPHLYSNDIEKEKAKIIALAVKAVKKRLREEGKTFIVGADGKNPVQDACDALTAALNAPKMAGLGAWVERWTDTKWQEPKWMSDAEVEKLKDDIYYGQVTFTGNVKSTLCANIGVAAYNAFVEKYNK